MMLTEMCEDATKALRKNKNVNEYIKAQEKLLFEMENFIKENNDAEDKKHK